MGFALFIFVTNTIYVMEIEVLELVVLARYLDSTAPLNLRMIHVKMNGSSTNQGKSS